MELDPDSTSAYRDQIGRMENVVDVDWDGNPYAPPASRARDQKRLSQHLEHVALVCVSLRELAIQQCRDEQNVFIKVVIHFPFALAISTLLFLFGIALVSAFYVCLFVEWVNSVDS